MLLGGCITPPRFVWHVVFFGGGGGGGEGIYQESLPGNDEGDSKKFFSGESTTLV